MDFNPKQSSETEDRMGSADEAMQKLDKKWLTLQHKIAKIAKEANDQTVESLQLSYDKETDWQKKAVLAARIINKKIENDLY